MSCASLLDSSLLYGWQWVGLQACFGLLAGCERHVQAMSSFVVPYVAVLCGMIRGKVHDRVDFERRCQLELHQRLH